MPRHMSFMLTKDQVRARLKTVTRRIGWWNLKPGEILVAVEKGQGLKRGEHVVKLCTIKVISTHREKLSAITDGDCVREGFPNLNRTDFILMFCKHNRCKPSTFVNRIEFEYV